MIVVVELVIVVEINMILVVLGRVVGRARRCAFTNFAFCARDTLMLTDVVMIVVVELVIVVAPRIVENSVIAGCPCWDLCRRIRCSAWMSCAHARASAVRLLHYQPRVRR